MEFYCGIEREFLLIEIKVKGVIGPGISLGIIEKNIFSIYNIRYNRLASSMFLFI